MTTRHIAIYHDDSVAGGVAIYADALARGLVRRGYRVTCIQSEVENPLIEVQRQQGVQHVWLRCDTRKDFWRSATYLVDPEEALGATRPDVVVFANCHAWSHLAAKTVAVRDRIPFVVVENYVSYYHDLPAEYKPFAGRLKHHYEQARAVVAVSRENLELLRHQYFLAADKGQVIHYGRPDRFFLPRDLQVRARLRREFGIPTGAVWCLTIGRLEEVKGYQYTLQAMATLAHKRIWPKLYFAWLGAGRLQAAFESMQALGLADHVQILGHRWDVPDWLDACDLFLLPSMCEGMPLSIMEAMAKGLPVVATAVSGIPEQLGETGKLLPSPLTGEAPTVAGIVATLEEWASDEPLREALGTACRQRASTMFREERMVDQMEQVIRRALGQGEAGRRLL